MDKLQKKVMSMKVKDLREEIKKVAKNTRGYSKMKKQDLVNVILKNNKLFMHLVKDEKSIDEKILDKKKQLLEKKKELKSKKDKKNSGVVVKFDRFTANAPSFTTLTERIKKVKTKDDIKKVKEEIKKNPMADNSKKTLLKKLEEKQKSLMRLLQDKFEEHRKHHTQSHIEMMKRLMKEKNLTFEQAHIKTLEKEKKSAEKKAEPKKKEPKKKEPKSRPSSPKFFKLPQLKEELMLEQLMIKLTKVEAENNEYSRSKYRSVPIEEYSRKKQKLIKEQTSLRDKVFVLGEKIKKLKLKQFTDYAKSVVAKPSEAGLNNVYDNDLYDDLPDSLIDKLDKISAKF
tara:strand:- start:356 stop:1381 length:1026 start_codon:yes stop_codon:yes gene_type:complete